MIHSFLIISQSGQPRLARFYTSISTKQFKNIIQKVSFYINRRPQNSSNFIFNDIDIEDITIVYRKYGSLSFVILADTSENELACLDVIQCFAETLNLVFEGVDENDLLVQVDKVNFILDQIICCGSIISVDKAEAYREYKATL